MGRGGGKILTRMHVGSNGSIAERVVEHSVRAADPAAAKGVLVNALPTPKWCSFWANPSLDEFSAQGPVPTPWTQVDPGVFSRLRRAAPGNLQRPCGCAWNNSGRMVGDCLTTLPLG
jgi:hypothetical protein